MMTSYSSSILFSFIILSSYFQLSCYSHEQDESHGQKNRTELRMGRKEMGHGHKHGQGEGHGRRYRCGQGQEPGPGPGSGPGQRQWKEKGQKDQNENKNNDNKGGKARGMFVFGSSLVDNGNNIFLRTLAKPDSLPYGIDFPSGPTGRFTNGKTVIDVFSNHLQLPLLPPFYDPSTKGKKIINGVDFASGGSGIHYLTGKISGEVTCLNSQIENFELTLLPELEGELRQKKDEFLGNYLFVIGAGGNDYTMNYFLNPIGVQTLEDFTCTLIDSLSKQLKKLHSLGARKFVLMAAYPLGCYPEKRNEASCSDDFNNAAILFNSKLKSLVDTIPKEMSGSQFAFVDTYNIVMDLIKNPSSQGFKDEKNACCELRQLAVGGRNGSLCLKDGNVCKDRNANIFFDGIHPTEAVNLIIGDKAFDSNLPSEVYPINLSKLASL